MAFIKNDKRKTTSAKISKYSNTTNINLKERIITDGHGTADFERLLYKGCPVLPISGRRSVIPKNQPGIIDARRKEFAIKICNIIHSMDKSNRTKINIFHELVRFIRIIDDDGIDQPFCHDSISMYVRTLIEEYNAGKKGATILSRQNSIKTLILEFDYKLYDECKNVFISFPKDTVNVVPYTDDELKDIIRALFIIYDNYSAHLENDTTPEHFPLEVANKEGVNRSISDEKISNRTVSYGTNNSVWKADLVRAAYYITCFYTGVNSNPLLDLKISDLTENPFSDVMRRLYKLNTIKGRQAGKKNEVSIGFTNRSKAFFERWVEISKKLNSYEDGYLFSNIINDIPSKMTSSEISKINKFIVNYGIPALSSQRFRKTKATLIMRATGSIFMVAQGLNNSAETAGKHYADGDSVSVEFSLASALYVREQTALGKPLDRAVEESSFIFADPVKESDIGNNFKKLSNGLRCGGAFEEKAIKIKNALRKEGLSSKDELVACHKFLECFGCIHHAVVAEVDDVWLLLSFNDVILESMNRPAVNSKPTSLLGRVYNTLQVIMDKIKSAHKAVYDEAYMKYMDDPHPLWSDIEDIDILLGAY
ncbi:site-specific integrase [Marinobacterium lutimaris]|uniref:Phage integrase family protein n=1 Tax=Marinobacterium lutimaris TaxID=568106 RepID=A0A1H5WW77_9GAMM|nr:site-specific integrase [Marinobacterium lutimaris]SEG03543.1 hypothetical protein SAMN05444390_1011182 [Marinobacterium lutimaris]